MLLFCGTLTMAAQESSPGVRLLARPAQSDSVMLRWAPTDKETWKLGNQYGYVVERYTLLRDGQQTVGRERLRLTTDPLKPLPINQWQQYEERDKYISIAAECIFGESSVPLVGPVSIAKRHKEELNKFSFALYAADQSPLTARLSGLWLTDKTVRPNEKYLYTVHIATPDSISIDTAFAFTGLSEYCALPQPSGLKAQWADKKVQLAWNVLFLNHIYNSYVIEKSADGTHFSPVNDNAFVQAADEGVNPEWAYRTDSLPDNRTTWHYRIRGRNAFGETGPAGNPVRGKGRLLITQSPVITNKEVIENKQVKLSWTFPPEMNEYTGGFRVYRSAKPEGTKTKIHDGSNPLERSFTDNTPGLTNYYLLSVYDGSTEKFTPGLTYAGLIDSIPPAIPVGLAGSIDSAGVVRITWKQNIDSDIAGYRTYRSNRPDYEFMPIGPSATKEACVTDTVNISTLDKNICYRVTAIDLSGNQSDQSEILTLKRPDRNPPVTPVIREAIAEKNGIFLTWYNSSSEDVTRHIVYRFQTPGDTPEEIAGINTDGKTKKTTTWQDKDVNGGKTYFYQIAAEDDSKLRSPLSSPVQIRMYGGEQARQIKLKATSDGKTTKLIWSSVNLQNYTRILIYKAEGSSPLQLLGNTTDSSFTDSESGFGKTVHYTVRAVFSDGTLSDFSNRATVTL